MSQLDRFQAGVDAKREAARQGDGKFGTQALGEADVDLGDLSGIGEFSPVEGEDEEVTTVRAAYEAGMRDAFAKAAEMIENDRASAYAAVRGHEIALETGPFRLHQHHLEAIADKAVAGQAAALRAHAEDGFRGDSDVFIERVTTPAVEPDTCPGCKGDGYGPVIGPAAGGGDLRSGECLGCGGDGVREPGYGEVDCYVCNGTKAGRGGQPCSACGGEGTLRGTPFGRDEVYVPGYGTMHRRTDDAYPDTPYAIRLEANRDLSDDEVQRAAQLLGYNYRAEVRGEPLGDPDRDSPRSFVVGADTTKSSSDDLGVALEEFEENLPGMLNEGSPVRKTDRAGAGTKGTRLVEGFNDPGLKFEIYYDSVGD